MNVSVAETRTVSSSWDKSAGCLNGRSAIRQTTSGRSVREYPLSKFHPSAETAHGLTNWQSVEMN
ncbi:hypothetical protein ABID25_006386 [Mesorhizobium abyssinicae]